MRLGFNSLVKQTFKWILIIIFAPVYYIGIVFALVAFGIFYAMYALIVLFLMSLYGLAFVFEFLKIKFTRYK